MFTFCVGLVWWWLWRQMVRVIKIFRRVFSVQTMSLVVSSNVVFMVTNRFDAIRVLVVVVLCFTTFVVVIFGVSAFEKLTSVFIGAVFNVIVTGEGVGWRFSLFLHVWRYISMVVNYAVTSAQKFSFDKKPVWSALQCGSMIPASTDVSRSWELRW